MSETRRTLGELEGRDSFVRRHIGPDEAQIRAMLDALGLESLEALMARAVPPAIRTGRPLDLPPPLSEREALERLRAYANDNEPATSLIGMGYHGTETPGVVLRNVLENPGWYTAYTPYQAEVSQGRLEALLNYQQMVMDLTGLDLANASLLDEATAAAEAMAMSHRVSKSRSETFFVDQDCHPQSIAVVRTRARPMGIEVVVGDAHGAGARALEGLEVFGVLLQYPGSSGELRDPRPVIEQVHAMGGLVTLATDLLALALVESPGALGADIAVGNSQRFGVAMGYGGPHAAFFATRDAYKRQTPGRIIGVSVDSAGRPALRMALQTREQHIRREKATSNICTAQVLLAVMAGMYAVYHGPSGITRIARRVHRLTGIVALMLERLGLERVNRHFFDTLTVRSPGRAAEHVATARAAGLALRAVDADHFGLALDELTDGAVLEALSSALGGDEPLDLESLDAAAPAGVPTTLARTGAYLEHPVFNSHHSETEMLRYLRRLQAKDIALDRSMIPLGSCTMKLNATSEMIPVTWPGFAALHPFAPLDQARGYRRLFDDLERWLCEVTGFDAVSLQPNAGSQGEYTGLLVIRRYHDSRGESHRDVCLIPSSAHGTNPASAIMAGMRVVVVACDEQGNVDPDDLRARCAEHAEQLAALMITYPSTHGVYEAGVVDVCRAVHEHGGQVYLDGANLNALLGHCRVAEIGADVSHMNLHKTFAIPHGGGGPGMGPIGVREHLAPFLPGHAVVEGVNPLAHADGTVGTVAAAPWGSASILPISWAFIAMMGGPGLTRASEVAVLNANYVACRLGPHFPVVYTGEHGLVAHECIVDLRPIKAACGITVDDVAKRLVDYGFHAPTMSWPVHDTLMIEPTESESKAELDRFCDALIAIRAEIAEVESGVADPQDNVLHHAPHTADLLTAESWERPYSRERAFFPLEAQRLDKYWPPVGRVDNVYGDRHLACACPPLEAYLDAAG
jgi:glycine dehydrogenase